MRWALLIATHAGSGTRRTLFCMTSDYVAYDDLPWADEEIIRAHAAELVAMAESLGLSDLRYASSNRIVVTLTDHVEPRGEFKFSERASFMLGHQIRAYSDAVLKNPGVSPDLLAATPLSGVRWGGCTRATS